MVSSAGIENTENVTKNAGALKSFLSRTFGMAKIINAKMQKMVSCLVCAKKARMMARRIQCRRVFLSYAHLNASSESSFGVSFKHFFYIFKNRFPN